MFLRQDDNEKWQRLDDAVSKKFRSNRIRFVSGDDLQKILAVKLELIKQEIKKANDIEKGAASSAVKPRHAGKNLRGTLKFVTKATPKPQDDEEYLYDEPLPEEGAEESEDTSAEDAEPITSEEAAPHEEIIDESTGERPEEEVAQQPAAEDQLTPEEEAAVADEASLAEEGAAIPEQAGTPGLSVAPPDPSMAQANTGEDQQRLIELQQELNNLQSMLIDIQATGQEQGLLTEEELNEIICPLSDEINRLYELIQSDGQRAEPHQEYGPRNYVGDISRELPSQSTTFAQSAKTADISKLRDGAAKLTKSQIGKQKGWHGDSQGHAEAARARWAQEGSSGTSESKPKTPAQRVAEGAGRTAFGAAKEIASDVKRSLKRAGRGLADTVGDLISDYSGEAAAAGLALYLSSYLKGADVSPKAIGNVMRQATLERIDEVKNWKRIKQIRRALTLNELQAKANSLARLAARGGRTAGRVGGAIGRAALHGITKNPKATAFFIISGALGNVARQKLKSKKRGK